MIEKPNLLLVDDSRDDIMLLMNLLSNDYTMNAVRSGQACLDRLEKSSAPDLIILDVSMPEMDGYEACRRIRQNTDYDDIDIIFLSANDTTDEKLMGLEAGAVDYITKPFVAEILIHKIQYSVSRREQRLRVDQERKNAFQTAMMAMSNAGEMGMVMEFMRSLNNMETLDQLGNQVIASVGQFGCNCVLQLRNDDFLEHYSSSETASELEKELLNRLQDGGRIIERGQRAIINFKNMSLLIKNMPDDEELRGRYRDHIPTLLEGAQPKLESLVVRQETRALMERFREALDKFEQAQSLQQHQGRKILDGVMQGLQASFISWGLDEDQENRLMQLVETGLDDMMDLQDRAAVLEQDLKQILLTAKRL